MIKRTIESKIELLLKQYPVVLITGPRQVGKSTLVANFRNKGFTYISLDDIKLRKAANEDPSEFITKFKLPIIIDEAQYAPAIFDVIQSIVNKKRLDNKDYNGLFILTGSQELKLNKGIQSMAGRVAVISMCGLSLKEIYNLDENALNLEYCKNKKISLTKEALFKLIIRGQYPELYKDPNIDHNLFYSSYISTYINRDVKELLGIKDLLKFQKFFQYLASITGQELVIDNISRLLGIRTETINQWLSILLSTKIIYLLPAYSEFSLVKQVVKRPKIYFADTGLAAYLVDISNAKTLLDSNFAGAFFETFVFNEIRKSYTNNLKKFSSYYYRDKNQNEIDLILVNDGCLNLIEIKLGSIFSKDDIKAFKQISNTKYKLSKNAIICLCDNNYKLDEDNFVLSLLSI